MRRAARVLKTGVRIEQHPDPEPEIRERIDGERRAGEAAEALRAGLEAHGRSEVVYVRGILFVDVELDGEQHRWEWTPSPPEPVWLARGATSALADLARRLEARAQGRLFADARTAGLRVSRREVESAPREIELDASLEAQLLLD
jgi:hypothetical protein